MPNSPARRVAALASTLAVGGAERQLAALARGLRGRRYDFAFFTLRGRGAVGAELAGDGFPVEENILSRPARWLGVVSELGGYDLLLALDHNNVLRLLPAFARRLPPYVVLYHLQDAPPRRWRPALARAYAVAAVAESQLPLLAGVPTKRTVVIPNGVPLPAAAGPEARPAARRRLGLPADAAVAAAVARLSPEKGVDVLLEAMTLIDAGRRPYLVVAGDGPERPRLEDFARARLGGGCAFVGELADVSPVYRGADLFVLPSRRESTPLALLEAMSYGLATVAAAVGDVPTILSEGAGVTFPAGSARELARAVETLAAEPARRLEMGARARAAVARRYGVGRMLDGFDELLERALGANRRDEYDGS
ncbi:MAG TPA: glycosyltransferase family 4 protein [bacterium]|nr:glycosyltransferase family 4 protein [bacterium]